MSAKPRRYFWSLSTRISVLVSFAIVAIVGVVTAIGFVLASNWARSDQRSDVLKTAQSRLAILESLDSDGAAIVHATGASDEDGPFAYQLNQQWIGTDRKLFGPALASVDLDPRSTALIYRTSGFGVDGSLGFISIASEDGKARVFQAFDDAKWTSRVSRARLVLIVGAVLTSSGALIAGNFAGRRVTRPLADAATAARALATGSLSTRLPETNDPTLADLTTTFNEMVDALVARADMDRRFNADVSHELRSPLTTLTASLAVLQSRRHELSAANRSALDLLATDLNRFTRLVDDLLEISRIDAGAGSLVLSHVNVVEFLEAAIRSTKRDGVSLVTTPMVRIFEMEVDKRRIARTLINLVENAFNHGAEPIIVTAVEMPAGDLSPTHVRITVEDRGEGVDLDHAEEFFERFNRGDRTTNSDGSGLGLALAREHVRLHNGTIRFEPPLHGTRGTRVAIVLPLTHPYESGNRTDALDS